MITVNDLKDQTGKVGPHPVLYCWTCGGEYSANKSDYFLADGEHVFECCEEPLDLVVKRTYFESSANESF